MKKTTFLLLASVFMPLESGAINFNECLANMVSDKIKTATLTPELQKTMQDCLIGALHNIYANSQNLDDKTQLLEKGLSTLSSNMTDLYEQFSSLSEKLAP